MPLVVPPRSRSPGAKRRNGAAHAKPLLLVVVAVLSLLRLVLRWVLRRRVRKVRCRRPSAASARAPQRLT
jgi:hypothetical protein